ncbi:MAG: L-seryl-tRNA(Sec) selenium transferase [Dehalococcoidia bacterium]|nr:L-seryl-tRNA(Sec) selenium transferase [Dehalococcoidia bacterium]
MEGEFRKIPGVDRVLAHERLSPLVETYPHDRLVRLIRRHLERERDAVAAGKKASSLSGIAAAVYNQVKTMEMPSLRPVINATGVILHTNLGRAPLSPEATAAMDTVARGYSNLEFNLESGTRGSRQVHIESLLCELSGAEAALVVNNNASGVLLGLTALARRKEVIVSRGQAVEIGGGFRIPDVMRQSGAKLVEVGTTNCTYISDYEQAVSPRTAALMRVHSSNFRLMGFTSEVALEELMVLAERYNIPVLDDLGSGCFLDTTAFGLAPEPVVPQSVALGVGLVFFSGDKLVGGPQAGIIIGRKQLMDRLRRHPLARAVRIDKVRLAGLAATLLHYLKGEATSKVPVWRMIAAPVKDIEKRAEAWKGALGNMARVVDGETMVGGGSLPGGTLPTRLVAIGNREDRNLASRAARKLRVQEIPVVGRIADDILLLDPRSVLPEEDKTVVKALRNLASDWHHTS